MNESLKDILTWYEDSIPESFSLLNKCIGRALTQIVCHHLPGEDGRLLDTIELRLVDEPIYLRAPRAECMAKCFPSFTHFPVEEFVSRSPVVADWHSYTDYQQVSHLDVDDWKRQFGKTIERIDLLLKLSPSEIQGIRLILDDKTAMNYHFAWGRAPGDLVSAKIGLVVGRLDIPDNIQWAYIPWIWQDHTAGIVHEG